MSEFYFDYKCISMNASSGGTQGNPDKALDFYLYQDYAGSGEMCVQIYVPKTIQKQYCGARLYFKPNSADFPDMLDKEADFRLYEIAARDGGEHPNVAKDNCVMVKGSSLSGCGILAFIDGSDIDAPPKPENAYKFIINYTKKETISYCIEEKKKGLTVRIIYPLIRTPVTLGVLRKEGAKPVLIGDRKSDNNYLKNEKGERVSIVLKPTGRKSSTVTVNLGAEATSEYDFRLVFDDLSNNKHYMLVDESEYTIEDREDRRRALSVKRQTETHVGRCPFCGRPIVPALIDKTRYKASVSDCRGRVIALWTPDPKLEDKHTVVCAADIIGLSEGKGKIEDNDFFDYGALESPADRVIVPPSSFFVPSMNVVVAGFPKSGKTMYLASVMNMECRTDKAETDPILLHKILNKFGGTTHGDNKEELAAEVKFNCVRIWNEDGATHTKFVYDYEDKRASVREADGKIKMRYAMNVGNDVESYTSPMDAVRLSYNPIGYELGKLGNVYFYDVPGELFEHPQEMRAVDVADCFIAVIDGDPKSNGDPIRNVRTALENIKRMETGDIKLDEMPIAIVFTKHDKKLSDYVPAGSSARDLCFDENCHVVREDILGLIKSGKFKYAGSALERHVDCSSYELEHYLKARNPEEFKSITKNYTNIKFFTCSALGNDVCLKEKDGYTKEVLFKPRRMRVELPLIWLMYQKGLIKE